MQYVFPILVLLTMLVFVASTFSLSGLLKHLRVNHSRRWEAMDRPSAIRSSAKGNGAIFRFLTRQQWAEVDDPELARRGQRTLRLSQLALVLLALLVVWVAVLSGLGVALS